MKDIKVVLIDADDTLLDFSETAKKSLKEGEETFNLTLPDNTLEVFFETNTALWQALERGELTFEKLHEIRWGLIFEKLGVDFDGQKFESVFWKRLREIAVMMRGADDLLEYLSKKYTICVASNAPVGQQERKLTEIGLFPFISQFFVSGDIGYAKPKAEFFDECMRRLGVEKHQVIMIGDSLTADIIGAKEYGIKTCWFNHRREKEEKGVADFIVYELSEIKKFL